MRKPEDKFLTDSLNLFWVAIRFLEASNKENPTNYYTHLNLGTAYGVLEDDEKFLRHLNLCIKIDPNKFEGYLDVRLKSFEEQYNKLQTVE
jgi:hypothetical protein